MPLDLQSHRLTDRVRSSVADRAAHFEADARRQGHAADDADVRLAHRLAEIDRALDRAPGPIRYRPLRRAIWRALLLPARYVLWLYRQQLQAGLDPRTLAAIGRGAFEADDRACHQRAIDAMAIALVARAILGDARASALLAERIEGRPAVRRPDASPDPPPMDLEPIVRLLSERR
jgi:hypothetical protein